MTDAPVVRLAFHSNPHAVRALAEYQPPAPAVRLALPLTGDGGAMGVTNVSRVFTDENHPDNLPALLVSYVYLQPFLKNRQRFHIRDWVLDSGAFSAFNSGTEIVLQDYIDTCKRLRDEHQDLTEVFALDVIGDWKASLRNCEEMWRQGVEAIPCFHEGSPWHALESMASAYPKIALGGVAHQRGQKKFDWIGQCFARVWPKKIHGFGVGDARTILSFPFHSVDATNWEIGPCRFGSWRHFGRMSVRGSSQNLRVEINWYLDLKKRARVRWAKEMALLDTSDFTLRLADGNTKNGGSRVDRNLACRRPYVYDEPEPPPDAEAGAPSQFTLRLADASSWHKKRKRYDRDVPPETDGETEGE